MKVRKTLLVTAAGWAGLATQAVAQIPAPPVPAPLGTPVAATTPPPTTIWQKLGISKDQKAACKEKLCASPLGQLLNNATMPLTALSGGLIPPFCPTTPSAAALADPGAQGAAAAIQADEAGAKARRAAVRYLGTVDCHYWPEAEDALVGALRGDRNECVRWEAAMALGRGCCCTKKTIEALTIVVSCSDRDGAPKETSHRVHAAACAALDHCLSCYANVSTGPVQGEKPIERTNPPLEVIPLPQTPPPPPPIPPETASAKPINPGEAKPAAGLTPVTPPPAVVKRPVGPEYYAHVAKAPLAAVLTEARRVAEKRHSSPMIAETPFDTQGHSIATLMSYATGPDTQSVIPAGVSVPAGEVRAEIVSAKPENLWDLLAKPSNEGQVVVVRPDTVVVQQSAPKPVVVKREVIVVKPEVVVKRDLVFAMPEPVAKKMTLSPASEPMPKGEPLTLDFPPPVASYPAPSVNYPPAPMPAESQPTGPSPYYATAGTPTITNRSSEPAAPMVSTYHPTAATPHASVAMPMDTSTTGPSPYFATAATPTITNRPSEPAATDVSSYHATATTAQGPTATRMDTSVGGPSPYFATAATPTITNRSSEPTAPGVSTYHPTAATAPATGPLPVVSNLPSTSPYNIALPAAPAKPTPVAKAPAPLPSPAAMPATPMSTKPMPAPAAPVVPAATTAVPAMPANGEIIEHLLQTAKGTGPVEVRKASIQELAKVKANRPEVMVALDGLSDDPEPGVRAEAIIAAARLRMGR